MSATFPSAKIYRLQHEINILSGRDSVLCGASGSREEMDAACFDYFIAIFSEANELMDNFVWKHWAAEAKDGKRWRLVDRQNLFVEMADLWLFVTSLCQCAGVRSREYGKACRELPARVRPRKGGEVLVRAVLELANSARATAVAWQERHQCALICLDQLIRLTADCGLCAQDVSEIYQQKATIHKERMRRGRKQHGDKHAEIENKNVHI